jgi:integrase
VYDTRRHAGDVPAMPRKSKGARLYLDTRRGWVIRDGSAFIRTGCAESERGEAEKQLARYIGQKHTPTPGGDPMIAEVLQAYSSEHLPHTRAAANAAYQITALDSFWGDKRVSDITSRECRAYGSSKAPSAARRDLETLRAAVRYWNREYGPLAALPAIILPAKPQARQRWLTRGEVARMLWAARRQTHLKRFILLSIYTGSRSGVVLGLQWKQIDIPKGEMARTGTGMAAHAKKLAPRVRLGKRILSHLRRWQRIDGGAVSYLCQYDGLKVQKLRRSWRAAVDRAGLGADVVPHSLRHTRATWLMQAGIAPWEAAGALGMSVEMIERTYGHHHPDWQKNAAEV